MGLDLATLIESFHRIETPLSEKKIMHWAKVHKRKHGSWPTRASGLIDHPSAKPDTWGDIDAALMLGQRGLSQDVTTLEAFLDSYVEVEVEDLSEQKLMEWANWHRKLHGEYPTVTTLGAVPGSPEDTWKSLDFALERGLRGLPKRKPKDSLYWFLQRKVGSMLATRKATPVSESLIAQWAQQYVAEHGHLPTAESGQVPGVTITWEEISLALEHGTRGLAGGRSLESFVKDLAIALPQTSMESEVVEGALVSSIGEEGSEQEVAPAQAVAEVSPLENVESSLSAAVTEPAQMEPPTEDSLVGAAVSSVDLEAESASEENQGAAANAVTVSEEPSAVASDAPAAVEAQEPTVTRAAGRRRKQEQHDLFAGEAPIIIQKTFSREELSQWITSHYAFFRELPNAKCGKIGASGNRFTWQEVQSILMHGWEDVPAGTTLSVYLKKYRFSHIPLTVDQVLHWIDDYRLYAGEFPEARGVEMILGANGETWKDIDRALREGQRGLPSGSEACTLAEFIRRHRLSEDKPKRENPVLANLNKDAIVAWAREFDRAFGRLPRATDGAIPGTDETWAGINAAMSDGTRGFEGGLTLRQFLGQYFDTTPRVGRPKNPNKVINRANILHWIEEYREEHGVFPEIGSGKIRNTPFSWRVIASTLAKGDNDLPGGSSLKQFIYEEFGVVGNGAIGHQQQHSHA